MPTDTPSLASQLPEGLGEGRLGDEPKKDTSELGIEVVDQISAVAGRHMFPCPCDMALTAVPQLCDEWLVIRHDSVCDKPWCWWRYSSSEFNTFRCCLGLSGFEYL